LLFQFEDFVLDPERRELRRAGALVAVEPQVFDVLCYLVMHRDRVVRKEELLDEVWGDRFVSESALTSRIKDARRAVGDDGRRQAVIRTIHGRGYRFVAPVEAADAGGATDRAGGDGVPEPPAPPRTHYASGRYSTPTRWEPARRSRLHPRVRLERRVAGSSARWSFFGRLARCVRLIVFDKARACPTVPVTEIPPSRSGWTTCER
jgi:DNA-binding winged helix-turn-helix (wHTH) protein